MTARYTPLSRWLVALADGWRFSTNRCGGMVVEPMIGAHGAWSVLMVRGEL